MEENELLGLRQREWGWRVAAYLFLAGVGAGAYAVGAAVDLLRMSGGGEKLDSLYATLSPMGLSGWGWDTVSKAGICLGFPLLLAGSFFLISDLGVKPRALRVFLNPGTSWIARGSIIISVFMILGALHVFTWVWPFNWLDGTPGLRMLLEGVNFIFAVLTMIYTGVLLGASRSIPLWSTATLPILFLVSALSTGVMAVVVTLSLFARGEADEEIFMSLARLDLLLVAIEAIVLTFYLQATHRTTELRESGAILLKGGLAPMFWLGVVVAGLFIPAVVEALELLGLSGSPANILTILAMLSGLTGGLLLRRVVLAGGVRAPISAAGFVFAAPPAK